MPRSLKHRFIEAGKDMLARIGIEPARELNLYLVRHMLTEANVDHTIHRTKADKAIQVLPDTRHAGEEAARFLADRLYVQYQNSPRKFGTILVIYSPYERTQDSAIPHLYYLSEKFGVDSGIVRHRADDRLVELRTGLRDGLRGGEYVERHPDAAANFNKHVKCDAEAYAASPLGESYVELSWRVRQVQQSILNDYERQHMRHCIIIAHGGTNRAFVQGWMNYNPQWMMSEENPGNNWIRKINGTPRNGTNVDPCDFTDCGYIYGKNAPLNNPKATQNYRKEAEQSFVLLPQRPDEVVPPGTRIVNPFTGPRRS